MHDLANLERARAALSYIQPDDRDTWVKMGMAIKAEFGEAGFDVWDAWGATSDAHNASAARATWKSIKPDGKVAFGSLIYAAKQNGFKDDAKVKKPTKEEVEARKAFIAQRAQEFAEQEAVRHGKAAERAKAIWDVALPCEAHPYLERKGVKSYGLRVGTWETVNEETGEIKVVSAEALLIPVLDKSKKLWTLQGIMPWEGGSKLLLKDGAKSEHFFPLGAKPRMHEGRPVFVLAEGYATGASVHEATGHLVFVCIDLGNMVAVARLLRAGQPKAVILFAADNDTATKGNPGLTKAHAAAVELDGLVAIPPPGDFNDLHAAQGLKAVAFIIDNAVAAPLAELPPETPEIEPEPEEEDTAPEPEEEPAAPKAPSASGEDDGEFDFIQYGAYFEALGYDGDMYYFYAGEKRQQHALNMSQLASDTTMLMLARLEFWEANFGTKSKGGGDGDEKGSSINRRKWLDWIYRLQHKRGIYDASRMRGRGAWLDDGRVVFHHGKRLTVDGQSVPVGKMKSKYVYQLAAKLPLPAEVPLTDAEGAELIALAKMLRWSKPGAAALLSGWVFLAPVCGALRWRPHIWINGAAGSGKSTVLNDYVAALLGDGAVSAQGNSTEAGVRQTLKRDALPVVFDESEQNNEGERKRMENIIALIRQASTESRARTLKGTVGGEAMNFHVRSMFCLASIQVGMHHKADLDRLTKLTLVKAEGDDAPAQWAKVKEALYKINRDPDLPERMLRRSINLLPTILKNVDVFIEAAAAKFGSQRLGDQYGTMLAGCWSLASSEVATPEQAAALIEGFEWDEFTQGGEMDDSHKCLNALLSAKINFRGDPLTVGSLVSLALDADDKAAAENGLSLDHRVAARLLRENGINISTSEGVEYLIFKNTGDELAKLLKDSPFATDPTGQLKRLPESKQLDKRRFGAVESRATGVPLASIGFKPTPPI